MIAHIEPTFSGFGTSDTKDEPSISSLAPVQALRPNANSDLADRLVALAEGPKSPQPQGSAKKLLRSPVAVASLAGFTILALTASLAWIVHGQRPFNAGTVGKNTGGAEASQATKRTDNAGVSAIPALTAIAPKTPTVETPVPSPIAPATAALSPPAQALVVPQPAMTAPAVTAPALTAPTVAPPTIIAPKAAAQAAPTVIAPKNAAQTVPADARQAKPPKPRIGDQPSTLEPSAKPPKFAAKAEAKVEVKKPATDKLATNVEKSKEQLAQEQALKEKRRQVAKASTPSATATKPELAKAYPMPQAVWSDASPRLQTTEQAKPIARAEPQVSAPSAKQAMITEGKTREIKANVEALCSERSNFLSRGYCQNQYCAEPHRKNDPTCQRLRQYETARQAVNY